MMNMNIKTRETEPCTVDRDSVVMNIVVLKDRLAIFESKLKDYEDNSTGKCNLEEYETTCTVIENIKEAIRSNEEFLDFIDSTDEPLLEAIEKNGGKFWTTYQIFKCEENAR